MKSPLLLLYLLFSSSFCWAQAKDAYEEKYQWRLRQEILYGVYIPKDVNEAFLELNKKMDEASKTKFRAMTEQEAASKLLFNWITHNWGLYDGSRLTKYMNDLGIFAPDDMAGFLIIAYHRSLNKKPLEIKELVKTFQDKAAQRKKERMERGKVIFEKTEKRDTPPPAKNGQR
jgi:hypothetical protein